MFPNVRLMIVATLVSIVVLVCGFLMFAAVRATHEPLTRSLSAQLQLTAEGIDPAPAAGVSPFDLRFAAEPPAIVSPLSPSMLQLVARNKSPSWPDVAAVATAPSDLDRGPEPIAMAVSETVTEIMAPVPTPASVPSEIVVATTATPVPQPEAGGASESAMRSPEPATTLALGPSGLSAPQSPAAAAPEPLAPPLPLLPALPTPPATTAPPGTIAQAGEPDVPPLVQVATTAENRSAEPGPEIVATIASVEIPVLDLGTDPPVLTGRVPLPRAAPANRIARAAPAAAPHPAAKPARPAAAKPAARQVAKQVVKARTRKAHARAVATTDPFATFLQPNFQTGGLPSSNPAFQTQNTSRRSTRVAPMGGPLVGPNISDR